MAILSEEICLLVPAAISASGRASSRIMLRSGIDFSSNLHIPRGDGNHSSSRTGNILGRSSYIEVGQICLMAICLCVALLELEMHFEFAFERIRVCRHLSPRVVILVTSGGVISLANVANQD